MSAVRFLGISASLQPNSYNTKLLHAATDLLPEGVSFEIAESLDLPLYSAEAEHREFPKRVARFRERVARADAFVFACAECNFAVPATIDNALQWAARPPAPPFAWKACAIVGASTKPQGTMRAQVHLRQICGSLNMQVVSVPQLDVAEVQKRFDGAGRLVDEPIKSTLRLILNALCNLTMKITPPERLSSFLPYLF